MEVLLKNAQRKVKLDSRTLKSRTTAVLSALDQDQSELSVLLTNDAKIRELNYNYRNLDKATDVLSFPQEDEAEDDSRNTLLGDVVISVETAARQAPEHHLTLEQELVLLIIHGVLHLLGYDHERSAKEARVMKQLTAKLFQEVFPGVQPSGTSNF